MDREDTKMLLSNIDSIQIVKEAYYGKPKEFISAEKELKLFLRELNEDYKNNKIKNYYNNEHIINVERLIKTALKLKDFHILIYTSTPGSRTYSNAYTITGFVLNDWQPGKIRAKSDNLKPYVYCSTELIINTKLTEKELMGIILHEIGHNFDRSFFCILANPIMAAVASIPVVNLVYKGLQGITTIKEIVKTSIITAIPGIAWFVKQINDVYYGTLKFTRSSSAYKYMIYMFNHPELLINDVLSIVPGYGMEKYADSFAASYGYATDLATAFGKMRDWSNNPVSNVIDQIPVVNTILHTNAIILSSFFSLFDPHPSESVRIKTVLNKLKREIEDPSIPPYMKKDIKDQIKNIEKYLESDYLNSSTHSNKTNPLGLLLKKMVFEYDMDKIDPREMLEHIWRHEE
jgi:hypothetical protein